MKSTNYNNLVREFVSVADAMNRMIDSRPYDYARNGGNSEGTANVVRAMRLPIDAVAGDDAFEVHAYLPGVNPETVEITFEGDELTIKGAFPLPAEKTNFLKQELYHGAFERRLTFNVPVNADAIEATFENGLLTLRLPKAEAVKPKQIKVQVK